MPTILRYGEQTKAFAFEKLTVADSVKQFTAATIAPTTGEPANRAVVTVETAALRYTTDGTAPTTTDGHLLNAGDYVVVDGVSNVANFKAIRTTGSSATIQCTYERYP